MPSTESLAVTVNVRLRNPHDLEPDEDISRDQDGYILATLGLNLDEENFVTDRRTGARCWAGLGSWATRLAHCIHMHGEFARQREQGRVAA